MYPTQSYMQSVPCLLGGRSERSVPPVLQRLDIDCSPHRKSAERRGIKRSGKRQLVTVMVRELPTSYSEVEASICLTEDVGWVWIS